MKEKEKNSQQIYKVRVYRDFDYPSFSINKSNKLEDLSYRAMEEVRENHNNNQNYFNFEIINVLPFSIKAEVKELENNTDFNFFIKEISFDATKEKFGDLNYETNPSIFYKGDKTDTSVTYYLIPEVEDYYISQIKKYTKILEDKRVGRYNNEELQSPLGRTPRIR